MVPYFMKINNKVKKIEKVFFIHGGVDEDREEVRVSPEEQDNTCIIVALRNFSTGINIKNLHNVIFLSPSKSRSETYNLLVESLEKQKQSEAKLFDIDDDTTYNSRKNYTLNHFIERVKIYNQEQFNYDISTINIKE